MPKIEFYQKRRAQTLNSKLVQIYWVCACKMSISLKREPRERERKKNILWSTISRLNECNLFVKQCSLKYQFICGSWQFLWFFAWHNLFVESFWQLSFAYLCVHWTIHPNIKWNHCDKRTHTMNCTISVIALEVLENEILVANSREIVEIRISIVVHICMRN